MLVMVTEFVLTMILFASLVILNFVMFRIPIKGNDKQIVFLALVVGAVNYYFKFIIDSPLFMLFQVVTYIILLMVVRRYPILYSVIVCITGSLAIALIDTFVTVAAIRTFSTMELMKEDLLHFSIAHLTTSIVCLLAAFLLYKTNIGFSFVRRRFSGRQALKRINFIWAFLLLCGLMILQFTNRFSTYDFHIYIILFVGLFLAASIIYAYYENKKVLKDRYGRD